MKIPLWVEEFFFQISDWFSNISPQKRPSPEKLSSCKIISHRGQHDNLSIFENTLNSFGAAKDLGAWGIEFDIRWSRDEVPVIFHDSSTLRLFGTEKNIGDLNLSEIKESFPLIPTLEETLNSFGKKIHLMIELKEKLNDKKKDLLKDLLGDLNPVEDFHFLALNPQILKQIDFVPSKTLIPVARLNALKLSQMALKNNWGGISGHYYLISKSLINKFHQNGLIIGSGHINSLNCLYRELNRNADWIFTNDLKNIIP